MKRSIVVIGLMLLKIIAFSQTKPISDFTPSIYMGCSHLTVSFFNQTLSSSPTTYFWDFGDDKKTTSTLKNPSHTYKTEGTYNVMLISTNQFGSDTTIKTIIVTSKQNGAACTIISGTLISSSSCGNIPVANCKIVLRDINNNIITSVLPVTTKSNGTFSFSSDNLAKINTTVLFTFSLENGAEIENPGYNTIEGWF